MHMSPLPICENCHIRSLGVTRPDAAADARFSLCVLGSIVTSITACHFPTFGVEGRPQHCTEGGVGF